MVIVAVRAIEAVCEIVKELVFRAFRQCVCLLEHLACSFHTTPGTLKVSLLAVPLYNVPTHWKIFHGIHTTSGTLVVNILTLPSDNESVQ